MKLGIHQSGEGSFSERWMAYCKLNSIEFKVVNCYASDIVQQLSDCDGLMWHFHQNSVRDSLFAKQLLYSVQSSGRRVFPDFHTCWHFDDKVGQKYLLEALGVPLVASFVFYTEKEALAWASKTSFPKVFKLRGGAGSQHVRLVRDRIHALRLIKQAFSGGFSLYNPMDNLKERYRKYRAGIAGFDEVLKGVGRLMKPPEFSMVLGKERGYAYFQDFIPGNSFDIRVVVIGGKAFAIKRLVRPNDFRASGSGSIKYEKANFPVDVIKLSFDVALKTQSQCIAIDYVLNRSEWQVVEVSYGFSPKGYDACAGYWDNNLHFHEGKFDPYGWMVESTIRV